MGRIQILFWLNTMTTESLPFDQPSEPVAETQPEPAVPTDQIVVGDAINTLKSLPAEFADLVFADPPYNIGFKYNQYHDEREDDDYVSFTHQWVDACIRATKPTGSMFFMIGDEYAAEMRMHLKAHEKRGNFVMRNWIVWHYTFGQRCKYKFNRSHAHIFYCVKDETKCTFNDMQIRIPSLRQLIYNDQRADQRGKIPDDTWVLKPQWEPAAFHADTDTWAVSRVCGSFHERVRWHPCQIPMKLMNRIIKVASNPGDMVLDPFSGSGTTAIVAAEMGRRYLGIELSEEYVEKSRKRIAEELAYYEEQKKLGNIKGDEEPSEE